MAVKTPGSLVLPILLLCLGLLLSGCAEKDQTVSQAVERSDFSSAGSSASGSVAGSTGEGKDIMPVAPGGPGDTGAADTGGTGINDMVNDTKNDQKGKAEDAGGGTKAATAAKALPAKAPEAEDKKRGTDKEPTGTKDLKNSSGNEVPKNNGGDNGDGREAQKESAAPKPDSDKPVEIKFSEMYSGSSSRGLKFSDKLTGLDGRKVVITGYMAPPLKPSFTFFVLTRQPMAICPFCSTDASWPEDIILVYLPKGEDRTPTDSVLTVTGTLELGSRTDPDTGFVSQVRIYSDKIKTVR
jgi:hypothetical protein